MFRPKTPIVPASTTADALATTTTSVNVSNAAAPGIGYEQVSTSSSAAIWRKKYCYNVKDYGLKGDGIDLLDGVVSASSTSFSSSSATFTSADTGKLIGIKGAGTGGGWLITTLTYVSAHVVTLAVSASYTVSAKEFFYGTDDSDAFQDLINLVFASGGGKIVFPVGLYLFNRVLQNGITGQASVALDFNSQFYIPNIPADSGSYYVSPRTNGNVDPARCLIEFEGESAQHSSQYSSLYPTITTDSNSSLSGVRLRSTIQGSGTLPSFFGGKGGVSGVDNYWNDNPCNVIWRNANIQLTVSSGNELKMGGLNLKHYKAASCSRIIISPYNAHLNTIAEPTLETAGIVMPWLLCEPMNTAEHCLSVGMKHGFIIGEHSSLRTSMAICCLNTIKTTKSVYYVNDIHNVKGHKCKYFIATDTATSEGYQPNSVSGVVETTVIATACSWESSVPATDGTRWFAATALLNDPSSFLGGSLEIAYLGESFASGHYADGAAKIGGDNFNIKVIAQHVTNISTHTGTTFTFSQLYEANQFHEYSNANPINLTIPNSSSTLVNYDFGQEIKGRQSGAGQITFVAASGVTLRLPTGMTKTAGQYSEFTLRKVATNTWSISGDLA